MPLNIKYRIDSNATIPSTTSVKGSPLSSFEIDGNFRSIKEYGEQYIEKTLVATLRANRNLTGGGTITFDSSGYLLWSTRFIVISNGRGTHFGTQGYFDINCPTSGTITGVGGAANVTATAAGIPIGTWQALYYILPIGSSSTSVAANFRVASYTADLVVPDDWLLLAVRNGDTGQGIYLHNGYRLEVGQSIDTTLFDAKNSDLLDGNEGSYYLDWTNITSKPNYVASITAGTDISVTGTAGVGWTPTIANTSTLSSVTSRGATTATAISLTNTTESNSSSTGALTVSGGVGVAKNLYVGQTLYATAKSFLIDHPTKDGMKLRHGSLEGPENGVYVRGRTKSHIIELPEYWTKLIDPDSITVQLTPIGSHQKLYVQKIENNKVYIENDVLSTDVIDCFYYIMAERIDIDKLKIEIEL